MPDNQSIFFDFRRPEIVPFHSKLPNLHKVNMWTLVSIACLSLLVTSTRAQTLAMQGCDNTKSTIIINPTAHAFIAGLFGLRTPGENGQGCGTPDPVILPSFEAARWAINNINSQNYIPGVKIGMKVYDTCGRPEIATRDIMEVYPNFYSNGRYCTQSNTKLFLGVMGASKSGVSMGVADWLGKLKGAQVSPASSATSLGDKAKYPSFMRTIPTDSLQAKTILEVLKKLQWKFINLVYTNDVYGKDGYNEILRLALDNGICVTQAIPVDPVTIEKTVLQSSISRLTSSNATAVVYFGSVQAATQLMNEANGNAKAGALQWLFSGSIGGSQEFAANVKYKRGILAVAPGSRTVSEFRTYWLGLNENNNPSNPWHKDWYMTVNKCKLPGVTYAPYSSWQNCPTLSNAQKQANYIQNQYVTSAIDAVYTFASALKKVRADKNCGTAPACSAVSGLTTEEFFKNYLKKVQMTYTAAEGILSLTQPVAPTNAAHKVSFDNSGELVDSWLEIWNYNNIGGTFLPRKVGYFYKQKLDLFVSQIRMFDPSRNTALTKLPISLCPPTGCGICLTQQSATKYLSIPGDLYINGVFSVHNTVNGLTCGTLRKDGAQLAQAFVYAIKNIKTTYPNILRNVSIGAIGVDDCSSASTASSVVTNFHSGIVKVVSADGKEMNPANSIAYSAAHDSSITVAVAEVLSKLRLPQVGYRSTSMALAEKSKYPYFLRTVPKDNKQARAIVLTLKKMGWQYVQAVQSPSAYGREGVREFISQAASEDLCVTARYEFSTHGNYVEIVKKLLTRPEARVVVVFGEVENFRGLLQAMKSENALGKLVLFGSETWGNTKAVVKGIEADAAGTFSIKLFSPQLQKYQAYLQKLNVSTYIENPWFREWYQGINDCYLSAAYQPFYNKPCNTNSPITSGVNYEQNEYAYYIINAVYSIAMGLDNTLKRFCSSNYVGVCSAFRTAGNKGEILLKEIEKVAFKGENGIDFKFIEREGDGNYEIYNYHSNTYTKLGDYKFSTDALTINTAQARFYNNQQIVSRCVGGSTCQTCLQKLQSKVMYLKGDLLIGAVFPIHYTGSNIYTCGKIKPFNGFQYSEAFAFAIEQINKGLSPIKFRNVTLGGVGFDDCSSEMQASNLVSTIHSDTLKVSKDGQSVNPSNIHAWMTYGSYTSMKVGEVLRRLQLPLVSPSATTVTLKDKVEYSTFYRTVPPDDRQMAGLAMLLKEIRISCVQTFHSATVYGRTAFSQFRRSAKDKKLCIPVCYEMGTSGNISTIMQQMAKSTTRVVVVIAEPEHVVQLLEAKKNNPAAADLIFIGSQNWGNLRAVVRGYQNQANNAITMKVQSPVVQAFTDYMRTKYATRHQRNPWFDEYYQRFYECNLPNQNLYKTSCTNPTTTPMTSSPNFEQENWVVSTIDAVYAIAQALDFTLKEVCGDKYDGVCARFSGDEVNHKILQNLAKVNFKSVRGETFIFNDRSGGMGYDIYKYNPVKNYVKVGQSDGLKVALPNATQSDLAMYKKVKSGCSPCDACKIGTVPEKREKFTLIQGDIMLGGMFDVHKRDEFPFACADVKKEVGGFQMIEAFNHAIERINSKRGVFGNILHGVTLGGLGLDACESAIRAGNLIADFHSGVIKLEQNGQVVDPKKIIAYIGASATDRSMQMAEVLTVLGIPQISYGSSGMQLKDRKKYPFFSRTIPSDDKQMRGIVQFLKRFDVDNIQIINSPDAYGISASQELIKMALQNDICVAQNITFQDRGIVTVQSARNLVNLLLNRPNATVVVTILPNGYINLFLQAVKATGISGAVGKFRFIASEGWGNDPTVIKGAESFLAGTVTFNLESATVTDFDEYLKTKFPNSYTRNPWFAEYYQKIYECTLPGNILKYSRPCADTSKSVVGPNYKQDPLVMYVVNAVYSAAFGIDKALKKLCGNNYMGLCEAWKTSLNKKMLVLQGIKEAQFYDASGKLFRFVGDGESVRGYDVYSLDKLAIQGAVLAYSRIGNYFDNYTSSKLDLKSYYRFNWKSNCSFIESCNMCPYIARKKSAFMKVERKRPLNMVGFFDVHEKGTTYLNCGKLDVHGGFQQMLAFFYALEVMKSAKYNDLSTQVEMGGLAIDTCSNVNRMQIDLYSFLSGQGLCYYANKSELVDPKSVIAYMVQEDEYTMAAGRILKPWNLTAISPVAMTPKLNDNNMYPFVLRTMPPCNIEASAVLDILNLFGWEYFLAVYSEDECGRANIDALMKLVTASNGTLCMGKKFSVRQGATYGDASSIMNTLAHKYSYGRVVVLFTNEGDTRLLLQASHGYSHIDRFTFIGGTGWGAKMSVFSGFERVARGAITLQMRNYNVPSFMKWITSLNMTNSYKIPKDWFQEFWQHIHECFIPHSPVMQYQYNRECMSTDVIKPSMIKENPKVLQTVIATYIAARGMSDLYTRRTCVQDACSEKSEAERRALIFNAIKSANWKVLPDDLKEEFRFLFTAGRYGNTGYFVYNLQKKTSGYAYEKLGTWSTTLSVDKTKYQAYQITGLPYKEVPKSSCPDKKACGCERASPVKVNTTLSPPPEKQEFFISPPGIVLSVLNLVGGLMCFVLFFHFICFYPGRGGTQTLGYFCLFSTFLLFGFNFSYLVHACPIVCGVRRFCQGVIYAMIFSPMLVKVMNTWRIAGLMQDDFVVASRRRFSHPCGLITITACFIIVQVIVGTEWLIIDPPAIDYINFNGQQWPRCSPEWFYNQGLVLSCLYVMFLMVLTTFFAGICWPVKENNHEARWIMGASCFVMGSWIVWCIVSTMTDMQWRDGATAIGNLFSGYGILAFVFFRKCHLLQQFRKAKKDKKGAKKEPDGLDYPDGKDSEKHSTHSTKDDRSFR